MPNTFSSLRSSSAKLLDKLTSAAKEQDVKQTRQNDDRFWKLSYDPKTGIGYAKIRFLPPPPNEDLAWVRVFNHAFKGLNGSWYFENCPTTVGNTQCPVCQSNNKLWNSGIEDDKKICRDRKRQLSYFSNIIVLDDTAHPENNGKVFLFRYGKKLFEKISDLMEPKFPDQAPSNPFDIWTGHNFKLRSQKVGGFLNYDKSEFEGSSELFANDKDKETKQETVWNAEYPLSKFVEADQFKSYNALEAQLNKVLSASSAPKTAAAAVEREQSFEAQDEIVPASKPAKLQKPAPLKKPTASVPAIEEEEDIKQFFSSVLNDED